MATTLADRIKEVFSVLGAVDADSPIAKEILTALSSTADAERLAKENEGLRGACRQSLEVLRNMPAVLTAEDDEPIDTAIASLKAALAEPAPEAKQ